MARKRDEGHTGDTFNHVSIEGVDNPHEPARAFFAAGHAVDFAQMLLKIARQTEKKDGVLSIWLQPRETVNGRESSGYLRISAAWETEAETKAAKAGSKE
jgi:hypothetical protein